MNGRYLFAATAIAAYLGTGVSERAFGWCFWEKNWNIPAGVSTNPVHVSTLELSDPRRRQNQYLPQTVPDGNDFRFAADGTFTFFHLTDYHRTRTEMSPREQEFFDKACRKYRPKLAVVTGDNVGRRCRGLFESVATPLVKLFTDAELPFAITFGNHDTEAVGEGWYTAAEQWAFYAKTGGKCFVDRHDPSVPGGGVQAIDVRDAQGAVRFRLAVMDSGDYGPADGCDSIRTPSVAWARRTLKDGFPTLFFQHIVVPETRERFGRGLFRAAKDGEKGVRKSYWDVPYVVNEQRAVGELKEGMGSADLKALRHPIYLSEGDTIYDVWRKAPNFRGAYFGHDHVNSVDGTTTDGVRLGFSKTPSSCGYNDGKLALRVFRLHADGTFETFMETEVDPRTVSVTCPRPSHVYAVGEAAEFEVKGEQPGTPVEVAFSRAYLPPVETLLTTTPARVSFALKEPGFVVCTVRERRKDGTFGRPARAGAGFDPKAIRTVLPPPKDYDDFWKSAFAEQDAIAPDFTSKPLSNGVELISCRTVWGTRMYGFLRVPEGEGPFPLQVSVGGGSSIYHLDYPVNRAAEPKYARKGFLFIHLPPWEPVLRTPKEAQARQDEWMKSIGSAETGLHYWNCDKGPRERWFYRCILGSCRLIDHAAKRPGVDRARVYYEGASTGGGYGFFLAAFSPHIRAAICEVPNYGNMSGPSVGRPSGEDDRGEHWQTSLYYDTAYCAPRIKCPVLVTAGYVDNCCCPETVYCIYNALTCPRKMFDQVENGHGDAPKGYWRARQEWLDRTLGDGAGSAPAGK